MRAVRALFRLISAIATVAALAIVVAGCTVPPSGPTGAPSGIRAAFVVLGDNGAAMARVITGAAACPSISFDGAEQRMDVRMKPGETPARSNPNFPAPSKATVFPVLTCEKR